MEDMRAEGRPRVDGGPAGAVQLLVEVAEGAGATGGRLAEAAVGLGVAAERVLGSSRVHGIPLVATGLNAEGRKLRSRVADGLRPFLFNLYFYFTGLSKTSMPTFSTLFLRGSGLVCCS